MTSANSTSWEKEIRIKNFYDLNFYRNKYFELLEKMTEYGGWEELYLSRFNLSAKVF